MKDWIGSVAETVSSAGANMKMVMGDKPHKCEYECKPFIPCASLENRVQNTLCHLWSCIHSHCVLQLDNHLSQPSLQPVHLKPHKCNICGEGFKYWCELESHSASHRRQTDAMVIKQETARDSGDNIKQEDTDLYGNEGHEPFVAGE